MLATKASSMESATTLPLWMQEMDNDGSGTITVDELRDGLRRKGAEIALSEVSCAKLYQCELVPAACLITCVLLKLMTACVSPG